MFKLTRTLSVVAGLGFLLMGSASYAITLTQGDVYYVGSVTDGIPSSLGAEVNYINALKDLAAGSGNTTCAVTEICNREGSTLTSLPFALLAGATKNDNGNTTVDLGSTVYRYILGKYDAAQAGSLVWYSATGFTGLITLQGTFNGLGLSHTSAFNSSTGGGDCPGGICAVPEPGSLALLGFGLLGLGLVRRKNAA